ncbi:DegQ family serine endoprotease [bacterium]|nr:DegQ family serine endoprotease [bacterium]
MKPVALSRVHPIFILIAATFSLVLLHGRWAPPAVADPSPEAVQALSDSFAEVAQAVGPAVVSVHSEKIVKMRQPESPVPFGDDFPFRWFFEGDAPPSRRGPSRPQYRERRIPQHGLGSGVIIDRQGHILTNYHVVREMDEIKITLADHREFKAQVVGSDPQTDLAVIRIEGDIPPDLPTAKLGDSDKLRVGDWVLAIGAPFGLEQTVTAGIISAKGRANVGLADYEDFIQTDAAINPGNSGGPLANIRGEVIGINTAIATPNGQFAGVGFAIPVNMARRIQEDLLANGKVTRGLLGVIIQPITPDLASQFDLEESAGALVAQVNDDSPAARAGIKVGDVIVRYNGTRVKDVRHLRNLVAETRPGAKADVLVRRNGKDRTVTAVIGELTPEKVAAARGGTGGEVSVQDKLGLTIQPLTPDRAQDLGYEDEQGVLVGAVEDAGPAARAGLRPGDLITEVNRQPVTGVAQFKAALAKSGKTDNILMLVRREGMSRFVIVQQQ